MKDYSGNFTNVKEYWMRRDSSCYLIQDFESKVTWYSSDIDVYYEKYYLEIDEDGNETCVADKDQRGNPVFYGYFKGDIMTIGPVE